MEPQQASPMSKMDGTRLLRKYSLAILDLYIYIMKNVASESNLALAAKFEKLKIAVYSMYILKAFDK